MTSCQWSPSAGRSSSSAASTTHACSGISSRNERKLSTGSTSATSGRSPSSRRGHLGQLPVGGVQLRRGCDLDRLGVGQRALREGREPPQRLDLVAEQLDPHGALLGGRVDVEDAAPHRELAALEHLVLAAVAAGDQPLQDLVEVDLLADRQPEPVWAQLGVGDSLHQRDCARHDHRGALCVRLEECVERGDPQPDEVRRRRKLGLVADAARRVEADRRRVEVRAQVDRQVARAAIVGRDDQGRGLGELLRVEQRRGQERPQGSGYEGTLRRRAQLPPPGAEGHRMSWLCRVVA